MEVNSKRIISIVDGKKIFTYFSGEMTMKTMTQLNVEHLEDRCVPAQIYGWYQGTYAWHDDGQPAQDIQQVNVTSPTIPPSIKATLQTPVQNNDGTISVQVNVAATQGDVNPNLGFSMLVNLPQNTLSVSNATTNHLVATQINNGNQLNIAYATFQPGQAFDNASYTLTFTPVAGNEPNIQFVYLSPFVVGVVDMNELDAFYSSRF